VTQNNKDWQTINAQYLNCANDP